MAGKLCIPNLEKYLEDEYIPDKGIGWFVPPALADSSATSYYAPGSSRSANASAEPRTNEYSELIAIKTSPENDGKIHDIISSSMKTAGIPAKSLSLASGVPQHIIEQVISKKEYRPSKNVLLSLCIGLRFSVEQAQELLSYEGHDFRRGSRFDLIVKYCLANEYFDFEGINGILSTYGEGHLGA